MGQEQQDQQTEWAWQHSLKVVTGWQTCPRNIHGKQCWIQRAKNELFFGENVWCVCQHSKVRALSDHARRWKLDKETVLTYEPYHVDPQALNDLRGIMLDMGIYVWETGESAWAEGTNILILARVEVTAEDLGL